MIGYTETEICDMFRRSDRSRAQIKVLSELSLRPTGEIIGILKRHGVYPDYLVGYPKDLTGIRFGSLRVVGRSGSIGKTSTWFCTCDCGKELIIKRSDLTGKNGLRSCGCVKSKTCCTQKKGKGDGEKDE